MKKRPALTLERAEIRAESYLRHKEKLVWLLEKASGKSAQHYEFLLAPWESLQIFFRLVRAHVAGKFCAPAGSLSMVVAAVIYFVSPVDLIPDSIPVFGLVDDTSVLALVARSNLTLISKFRKWETLFEKDLASSIQHRNHVTDGKIAARSRSRRAPSKPVTLIAIP